MWINQSVALSLAGIGGGARRTKVEVANQLIIVTWHLTMAGAGQSSIAYFGAQTLNHGTQLKAIFPQELEKLPGE